MNITFYGAVRTVTGSMHVVEAGGVRLLLDCGLFQGKRSESALKNKNFPFHPGSISSLILSHAHLDHCGNIPNLVKQGFSGPIYCTAATSDLARVMLLDSAHIQEEDARYLNKKRKNRGEPEAHPLYTVEDAENCFPLFQPVPYEKPASLTENIQFTLYDAGHILGSSLIFLEENQQKLLFACDLGRRNLPILRDPQVVKTCSVLVLESTYGNRLHAELTTIEEKLASVLENAAKQKGKVIIPSFAMERTQELLVVLHKMKTEGKMPDIPVYVDSPLASQVTEVFQKHSQLFDEETRELAADTGNPFRFQKVAFTKTADESRELNDMEGPFVVISASGMCESGRILHHLKHGLSSRRNTILFIGFQAQHTLGRRILEKQEEVRIFDDMIPVRANIVVLNAFSAHADKNDLLNYAAGMRGSLEKVFLVHGEESACLELSKALQENHIPGVEVPTVGQSFSL